MIKELNIQTHTGANVAIKEEFFNERATIVHCRLKEALWIRMWPSTWLIQQNTVHKKLLHIFNIDFYPAWKSVDAGYQFTLVFEPLDKDCTTFDLFEEAEEKGGFIVMDIKRNESDVYNIQIGRENLQS